MATVNLGNIKFNWKGAYNAGTAYAIDDVVSYNGSSYVCISATTGNLPTVTAKWNVMATAGTNGTDVGTTITTQGDLLYRDGSGLQRLGAGTAGQVLQTGGSGANPSWGTVSSDMVKLATVSASGSASTLSVDGYFSATYKNYKFFVNEMYPSSTAGSFDFRLNFGGSAASSNAYRWGSLRTYMTNGNANASSNGVWDGNYITFANGIHGSNNNRASGEITLFNPQATNAHKHGWSFAFEDNTAETAIYPTFTGFKYNANPTTACTGLTVYVTSGNIASGNITIYGIK